MSEQPEIDIDEFFGVEQTDSARMEVKISYSALHKGRPYYPEVRYGDGPRVQIVGDEDEQEVVVESEEDLRTRVIATALRAMQEWEHEFLTTITPTKETE